MIVSPTLGAALLTDFESARSDCCGVRVVLAVLLPVSGSNWSAPVIVAVLVCAPGLTTVARIRSVCGDAVVTVPTAQIPLTASYVPRLGVAMTNVTPAGRRSVTCTPVAASGPLSVSVTV